jgi:hypothetical protein
MQKTFNSTVQSALEIAIETHYERAKWTAEKRKKYQEEHPENFAGPDGSFPIEDGSDVEDAWGLAGQAGDPDAVRAKVRSIAERLGLEASLPSTAKEMKRAVNSDGSDGVEIDEKGNHDSFSGTHSHTHSFFARSDDNMHSHDHVHSNDNDHNHSHDDTADRSVVSGVTPDAFSLYLPITRVDATERMVTGQATVEKPDAYGTIFGYYPEAWLTWRGNMREQHDSKKAVGKAVKVIPVPEERAIYVTSRVSRGAHDTWLKIEDGVLTGYSASIIPDKEYGNDPKKWPRKEYEGKSYPYLPRYAVAETSYVDNPATPGCNISIVRADGFLTEIVDTTEDDEKELGEGNATQDRSGARISDNTKGKMHDGIAHAMRAAVSQMRNCGCDNCMKAIEIIDPDNDNDIDLGGVDDPDGDWHSLYAKQDLERELDGTIQRIIERSLLPVYTRMQGIAATFSKYTPDNTIASVIERGLSTLEAKIADLPTKSSLDEVHAELSAVKDQVERIAEQPMPGGPVLNTSVVEKRLPTDTRQNITQEPSYGAVYDAIADLSRRGTLDTPDKQVAAMAAGLAAQRRSK